MGTMASMISSTMTYMTQSGRMTRATCPDLSEWLMRALFRRPTRRMTRER